MVSEELPPKMTSPLPWAPLAAAPEPVWSMMLEEPSLTDAHWLGTPLGQLSPSIVSAEGPEAMIWSDPPPPLSTVAGLSPAYWMTSLPADPVVSTGTVTLGSTTTVSAHGLALVHACVDQSPTIAETLA